VKTWFRCLTNISETLLISILHSGLFRSQQPTYTIRSTTILQVVMDRSEDQPHTNMWPDLHRLKTLHLREHVTSCAPYHTGARLRARITLHVSCSVLNHTSHNPESVMANTSLYKGELASLSGYTLFFTTLFTLFFLVLLLT